MPATPPLWYRAFHALLRDRGEPEQVRRAHDRAAAKLALRVAGRLNFVCVPERPSRLVSTDPLQFERTGEWVWGMNPVTGWLLGLSMQLDWDHWDHWATHSEIGGRPCPVCGGTMHDTTLDGGM